MNRSTGIVYLRPLVCPLSAIVAAILLCGSNHADAHVPPGIGVMYLENSDGVGDPIHNWFNDPALVPTPTANSTPTTNPIVTPGPIPTATATPTATAPITPSARPTATASATATPTPSAVTTIAPHATAAGHSGSKAPGAPRHRDYVSNKCRCNWRPDTSLDHQRSPIYKPIHARCSLANAVGQGRAA